jgi:hypothetical protein
MANVGRQGQTLVFTVKGADPAGQTSEIQASVFDKDGNPVDAFDTNWDGLPDANATRFHFDASTLGQKSFTGTVTLPGVYGQTPGIASAKIALSNVQGAQSPSVTVALSEQTVSGAGQACDPAEVTSRCTIGLGCSGTPATCQASVAPSLTQVAYYGGAAPMQLFVGNDPDEDLQTIQVAFLGTDGGPMTIDLGTQTNPDLESSTALNARGAAGQSFVLANYPAADFTTSVPAIAATPVDSLGHQGPTVTAKLSTQPAHIAGQSCDAYGLTGCAQGSFCSPGVVGATNTCGVLVALQQSKCTSAAAPATSGVLAAWGIAQGTSIWDPPSDCVAAFEVGNPESVVALKLTTTVSSLTISTAVPETNFDTILYVLSSCASSTSTETATTSNVLACNDDAPGQGFASTVTLTNVAPGTYYVVVDSAFSTGGQFGLTVTEN